jgi:CelD/BcsL family acetyltransferase involved in cellulose biosynthesis
MATVRPREADAQRLALEEVDAPESLTAEWERLATASGNVFGTWDWLSLWWEHYGQGRPLRIVACRSEDGETVAILPLYMWLDRRLRIARFLGHGAGDELGPVCAPDDRARVAEALLRIARDWKLHLLVADRLPGGTSWSALVGGRTLEREGSPVLHFETDDWDDFLASRGRHFRQELRRLERKLAREHEPRFRLADEPERLEADLDTLFALHEARWGAASTAFAGDDRAFQRAFARRAFERGWLRLRFLEVDGTPVAADYALRFAGRESGYQGGRDPAWTSSGVGFVILAHAMREALADGVREYRLLRGGQEFKYRFATDDPAVETVAIPGGPLGSAALAFGLLARRRPTLWRGLGVFRRPVVTAGELRHR